MEGNSSRGPDSVGASITKGPESVGASITRGPESVGDEEMFGKWGALKNDKQKKKVIWLQSTLIN